MPGSADRAGPTGAQYEIVHGDQRAVVVEAGGGLRTYDVAGRAVLEGYPADRPPDGGRGQVLAPWPNRVAGGRYTWDGTEHRLALTEPEAGNAIHGLLRSQSWGMVERAADRVLLGASVWPQKGYPFQLSVTADYRLGEDGLTVRLVARNDGSADAPYGVGQHPYLTVGTAAVDDAVLTVPASRWLRTDDRGIPVAAEPVDGSPYDFRAGRAVGPQLVDTAFVELDRDSSTEPVVRVAAPDGRHGVDLRLGAGVRCVQVFTGDTLPEPSRRREGLAVEPMSCPPDAFRTGTDLVRLPPGGSHVLEWGLLAW
jgi:aldose 1-epimerase